MNANAAAAMERQLRELKEAAVKAKVAQRKSDIRAAVSGHKSAGARRMVRGLWFLISFGFVSS